MLKSRSTNPPGGWKFTQPESGWTLKPGHHFNAAVAEIIKHRASNPRFKLSTDQTEVANELDDYTCARLKNDPSWCLPQAVSNFPRPLTERRLPSGGAIQAKNQGVNAAAVSKFLTNSVVGIKTWIDWFGDGKLVESIVAENRAVICEKCPMNQHANIAQRFTQAAVKEILGIYGALRDLDLHTSKDPVLHVCQICDCPLKAKVWCPLPIVKKHMPETTIEKLPDHCWIKTEN